MTKEIAIIGAGPAGLIAAEKLAEAGFQVTVYEAKPSVARKFLLAGRGGLNLTHSEDLPDFLTRYYEKQSWVGNWVSSFTPDDLRQWAKSMGVETFVGSSGRVFPEDFRATGLLRAWLQRLHELKVTMKVSHRWLGFTETGLKMQDNIGGIFEIAPAACLFALGGGSYAHMGADAKWIKSFEDAGIEVNPLQAANMGFNVGWSDFFKDSFQGQPLKNISLKFAGHRKAGEVMLTRYGIEGNAIYAISAKLRETIRIEGQATLKIDLKPGMSDIQILNKLQSGPGSRSLSSFLKSQLRLSSQAVALLREFNSAEDLKDMAKLAMLIKDCPVILSSPASMNKAISTAGGVAENAVDSGLMLKSRPGCFVAGEMLDWEAPTGGYLLQACFASGVFAAKYMQQYLDMQ